MGRCKEEVRSKEVDGVTGGTERRGGMIDEEEQRGGMSDKEEGATRRQE